MAPIGQHLDVQRRRKSSPNGCYDKSRASLLAAVEDVSAQQIGARCDTPFMPSTFHGLRARCRSRIVGRFISLLRLSGCPRTLV